MNPNNGENPSANRTIDNLDAADHGLADAAASVADDVNEQGPAHYNPSDLLEHDDIFDDFDFDFDDQVGIGDIGYPDVAVEGEIVMANNNEIVNPDPVVDSDSEDEYVDFMNDDQVADVAAPRPEDIITGLIRGIMNHCDLVILAIERKLTTTDLRRHQNNLALPMGSVSIEFHQFITNQERNVIVSFLIVNSRNPQQPPFLDPPQVKPIKFNKYTKKYVLNGEGWSYLLKNNVLHKGDTIQIWAFRVVGALGFALVMK